MTLVYDTEELTVRRTVRVFGVRGRTGHAFTGLLLAQDGSAILTENGDLIYY